MFNLWWSVLYGTSEEQLQDLLSVLLFTIPINSTKQSEHNIKVQSTNLCPYTYFDLENTVTKIIFPVNKRCIQVDKAFHMAIYIDELLLHKLKCIIKWYESLSFTYQEIAWKQCVFEDAMTVLANICICTCPLNFCVFLCAVVVCRIFMESTCFAARIPAVWN